MTNPQRNEQIPRDIRSISRVMDTAFRIPGTKIQFGWDSVFGLFPGGGDMVGLLVSLYVLVRARQLGTPTITMIRMAGNVLVDTLVGTIPIAGDVFDVFFKANQRNMNLLLQNHPNRVDDARDVPEQRE